MVPYEAKNVHVKKKNVHLNLGDELSMDENPSFGYFAWVNWI